MTDRRVRKPSALFALLVVGASLLTAVTSTGASGAAVLEPGFVERRIASSPDIRAPHSIKFGPDGRLYLIEQNRGTVRIVQNDVLLPNPLITIPVITGGSRGLMGIAFDPGFLSNGYFYVTYSTNAGGIPHNRLSRFTAVGNTASLASEQVLFDGEDLADKQMHYGGDVNIGPDGRIYLSTGDRLLGANAQNLNTTWGKMLRFNRDGTIPTTNPFYNQTTLKNRAIWARGLRNPFKFTFQPGTGRMFIGDVGSSSWEEVNEGAMGANYGWPTYEGPGGGAGFTDPVFAYNHNTGNPSGCAVMGGDFYNPNVAQLPAQFVGTFIFPDHCQGWVKAIDFAHGNAIYPILGGLEQAVDLKVDPNSGAIYYIERSVNGVVGGGLFRVDYQGSVPLSITQQPSSQTVAVGADATFSVSASGAPPISFQWQRNGVNIAGATSSTYTLTNAQAGDSGSTFRVNVSNASGTVTSNSATLTVSNNQRPTATIVTPAQGDTYRAGTQVSFSGTGTDPENGDLPASAYTWEVVFHHHAEGTPNAHTHPFIEPVSGATNGIFTIPTDNEVEPDVFYRIHLTVKDSAGATHEVTRDIQPRTSQITLDTAPGGLQVNLDDQPVDTPITVTSVEGIDRRIEALSPQVMGGSTYAFQAWSDGGARLHTISTPVADTTYTASFTASGGASSALFVTGNPASLGTDQNVVSRLQQLGYTVTIMDDAVADAAAAIDKSIVLVSSSVDSGTVANRFSQVSVPVMIWKPALYDNMQMTPKVQGTDFGTLNGFRTVNIANIAHPLAPAGAQTITIMTANNSLPFGRPPATADIVGRTNNRATLFTFSMGDLRVNGTPAPGCRVAFPLYGTAISRYTPAGWDLFDRTVGWATGGCVGAP